MEEFEKFLKTDPSVVFACTEGQQIPEAQVSKILYKIPIVKDYVVQGISDKCIKDDEHRIKLPNKLEQINNFDVFTLEKGYKLYKGMENYATPSDEKKYFDRVGPMQPTWVGHPYIAAQIAVSDNGGIHAYESIRPLKLMVWNDHNVELLYKILSEFAEKKGGFYGTLQRAFQISIGIGLPPGLRMHYINYLDNNTSGNIQVCFPKEPAGEIFCKGAYKDLHYYFRKYTHHVFVFKFFILPLVAELKMDGVFVPHHANPVYARGYWGQEIILLNQPSCLKRRTDDPLDWMHYKKYLDFKLPEDGFIIPKDLSSKNVNHRMMKWYLEMQNSHIPTYKKPPNALVLVNLNVHDFIPIRLGTGIDPILEMVKYVQSQSADIVVLHEVRRESLQILRTAMKDAGFVSHSIMENRASIVFSRTRTNYEPPVQIATQNHQLGIRYKRFATFFTIRGVKFCATHLSVGNYTFGITDQARIEEIKKINSEQRLSEIDKILEHKPDVIVGDLNFAPIDPEFKHLETSGYTTNLTNVKETTPFGSVVDYVFFKKSFSRPYTINTTPYRYSDHYPIVCTINNFYVPEQLKNIKGGAIASATDYVIPEKYVWEYPYFYSETKTTLSPIVYDDYLKEVGEFQKEGKEQPEITDERELKRIMTTPATRFCIVFEKPKLSNIGRIIKYLKLDPGHAFRVYYQIASQNTKMGYSDIASTWPNGNQNIYVVEDDLMEGGLKTTNFGNTILAAKLVLNANSLEFLKYQDLKRMLTFRQSHVLLGSFAKYLDLEFTAAEREQLLVYSGVISYALGLRKFGDIDAVWNGEKNNYSEKFQLFNYIDVGYVEDYKQNNIGMVSMIKRFLAASGAKTPEELFTNPKYYGYFMGIKCVNLQTHINLRNIRQRPKAMAELVALSVKSKLPIHIELRIPEFKIDEMNPVYSSITSIMENQFPYCYGADGKPLGREEIIRKRTRVDRSKYLNTIKRYLEHDFGLTNIDLSKYLR